MGVSFQRSHDIMIDAAFGGLRHVCNPNSWPEWLAASHHIDGDDRPLLRGETFREQWHIKRGEIRLAWTVTESDPPKAWTVEADTDFIGKIVIRYTFEAVAGGTKYTRVAQPRPALGAQRRADRADG
jgi:hypothetical protein